MHSRSLTMLTAFTASAAILVGCGDSGSGTTASTTESATATTAGTTVATTTTTSTSATTTTAVTSADDPVFEVIDAVLAAHPEGIITDIDREDSTEIYDVDVVVGDSVLELEVSTGGEIREEERESDDDDVRQARAATVTAAQAIGQALERHPEGVLDEIELDEEDGTLRWEIDLDDADRNDLAELTLPAN